MLDSDRGAVLVAVEGDTVHGVITFSCNSGFYEGLGFQYVGVELRQRLD